MEAETHVAALSFLISSHAAPLLSLIRHVAKQSPTTYISFFGVAASNASILSPYHKAGIPLPPNIKFYEVSDGTPDGYVFTGNYPQLVEYFLAGAKDSFQHSMKLAAEERGRPFTSLITDAFLWFGREIADGLGGVPWVPFWTAGLNSLTAHVYTEAMRESKEGCNEDELLTEVPGLEKFRVKDLPEGVVAGDLNSVFSEMLRKMGREILNADAVVVNSFDEFHPQCTEGLKAKFRSLLNVGPLDMVFPEIVSEDTYGCMEWLDGKAENSVAYVSFGTWVTPAAEEIVALAEALEERGVPFLWSMREKMMGSLPEGFVERTRGIGKVVAWAPQKKVLSHGAVGVFVTHCGWNSVVEGVAGGVPVICRPFYGDQRLNARAVEVVWGMGMQVSGGTFTKDGIVHCLDNAFHTPSSAKIRAAAEALRQAALKATQVGGTSPENLQVLVRMLTNFKI